MVRTRSVAVYVVEEKTTPTDFKKKEKSSGQPHPENIDRAHP